MSERVDAEEGGDLRAHARSRRKRRADAQPDASQAHAPEPEPKDRRPSPDADPDRAPLDPIFPQLVRDPESSEQKLI